MGALIRPTLADRPPPQTRTELDARARGHALRRLRERGAPEFSAADVAAHLALIQSGACDRISTWQTRTLFTLEDRGRVLFPLYDRVLRQIVTYLPEPVDISAPQASAHRRLGRL